jgi:competence protein ComEA
MMVLTRLEKITFVALHILFLMALGVAALRYQNLNSANAATLQKVKEVARLTSKKPLKKEAGHADDDGDEAGKLNVNKATVDQLVALRGMGRVTAERIVTFVKESGGIKRLQDLRAVKGISAKKIKDLSRFLTTKGGQSGPDAGAGRKLNINFADEAAIQALPGVGKKMARTIIDVRNQNGRFFSLEDLLEVPGMTPDKLKKFGHRVDVR